MAVALLKAIYDMVDRLKTWEEARGLDGTELFRMAQESLGSQVDESVRRDLAFINHASRNGEPGEDDLISPARQTDAV
jgi:hypothetical protein